jgi:hypothetical protein
MNTNQNNNLTLNQQINKSQLGLAMLLSEISKLEKDKIIYSPNNQQVLNLVLRQVETIYELFKLLEHDMTIDEDYHC